MRVLESYSASELATNHIRDLIIHGELKPGQKVSLDEFATALGVSRTPIRDALAQLQLEGLVEIVSRVGVYIREISVEEVLEVYSIKASLEPLMAQWATERSSEAEREAFADSARALPRLAALANGRRYTELVVERRQRMMEMARSEVLSSTFRLIDERIRLLRQRNLSRKERREASFAEHLAIAEAVREGDAARAAIFTREHVLSARSSLIALSAEYRDDVVSKPSAYLH